MNRSDLFNAQIASCLNAIINDLIIEADRQGLYIGRNSAIQLLIGWLVQEWTASFTVNPSDLLGNHPPNSGTENDRERPKKICSA
jgi:hypothetical protein